MNEDHEGNIAYFGPYPGLSKRSECEICERVLCGWPALRAECQACHPGFLGTICDNCYGVLVEEEPDLPWTDPISGRVDYEAMEGDLGVVTGVEDWILDEDEGFY